jgi:hypothetical protein
MNEDEAGLENDAIAGMAREPNKGKETVRIKILWGGFFEQ